MSHGEEVLSARSEVAEIVPPPEPDIIYDHDRVATLGNQLGQMISRSKQPYQGLVGIMNGGLVPLAFVASHTGLPIIDLIHLSYYPPGSRTPLDQPIIYRRPHPERIQDKFGALVDDVGDKCNSLVRGRQLCEFESGAAAMHTATLDFKPENCIYDGFRPTYCVVEHKGRPWIHYQPWEDPGTSATSALLQFVTMGYLDKAAVDRILELLEEG